VIQTSLLVIILIAEFIYSRYLLTILTLRRHPIVCILATIMLFLLHFFSSFFCSKDKDKYSKRNNMNSWNYNQKTSKDRSSQDNKPDHWKDEWPEEKARHSNRRERTGTHSHCDGSQNDRLPRDETTNNRFSKDRSYSKYDRGDVNASNRSARESYQNVSKFNERRYNRNNPLTDKACNETDISTKNNNKRGKGYPDRNDSNNCRGRNRDGGISGRLQTANWDDKKPNHKNSRFTGN